MDREFVELAISGVSVEEGELLPVVFFRGVGDSETARLSVQVGPFEASAILLELEGISPPRPLTHDLLAELFRESGMDLERVELFGEASEGPRARLVYRRGFSRRSREVRPSDAIALALRLKAPVCAKRALLATPPRSLDFPVGLKSPKARGKTSA